MILDSLPEHIVRLVVGRLKPADPYERPVQKTIGVVVVFLHHRAVLRHLLELAQVRVIVAIGRRRARDSLGLAIDVAGARGKPEADGGLRAAAHLIRRRLHFAVAVEDRLDQQRAVADAVRQARAALARNGEAAGARQQPVIVVGPVFRRAE